MTDDQLAKLFAEGTAPERDASFARHIDVRIGRARRGLRLVALAVRALVILMLAAALFVAVEVLEPALTQIAGTSLQFMGVPLPLILVVLAAGFAIRARRFAGLRLG